MAPEAYSSADILRQAYLAPCSDATNAYGSASGGLLVNVIISLISPLSLGVLTFDETLKMFVDFLCRESEYIISHTFWI